MHWSHTRWVRGILRADSSYWIVPSASHVAPGTSPMVSGAFLKERSLILLLLHATLFNFILEEREKVRAQEAFVMKDTTLFFCSTIWKITNWTKSYELTLSYKCDVIHFRMRVVWISQLRVMWQLHTSLPEVESSVFVYELVYVWYGLLYRCDNCKMWCMRWIM